MEVGSALFLVFAGMRCVPRVYLGWANPMFLAFFAFNRINKLRIFSVAFSPIPTALPKSKNQFAARCSKFVAATQEPPARAFVHFRSTIPATTAVNSAH